MRDPENGVMSNTLRVLVVFSDPPGLPPMRVTKEHRAIQVLGDEARRRVTLELRQASRITDIRKLICEGSFDVIQFSGHGSPDGIYLCKSHLEQDHLVGADEVVELLSFTDNRPRLIIFLCCFANAHLHTLAQGAPFIITAKSEATDDACVTFSKSFYDRFFKTGSIQRSYDYACHILPRDGYDADGFRLDRSARTLNPKGIFVECEPGLEGDTLLVNLDAVDGTRASLGIEREEFERTLAKKLRYHDLMFACPRQQAVLPIGLLLLGEFTWEDACDVVVCTKLMRLKRGAGTPQQHFDVWATLLTRYNDMASSEHRHLKWKHGPPPRNVLTRGCNLLRLVVGRFQSVIPQIKEIGAEHVLGNITLAAEQADLAFDRVKTHRHQEAVSSLELGLKYLHEVVGALQPPLDES